jgi:hypothetical protein
MATPTSTCRLLNLPRELRNEIYRYYLHRDEGYYHKPRTNKLRQADGGLIDLALSYTCKQVASEMRGLHLKVNTLTFKTFCSKSDCIEQRDIWHSWPLAGRCHHLLDRLYFTREEAFAATASVYGRKPFTELALSD